MPVGKLITESPAERQNFCGRGADAMAAPAEAGNIM
jgi:hypothetical protein